MIDLAAASGGSITQVWVTAGVYKPAHVPPTASSTTDRDKTFLLKPGVKVYGGFAGTETALGQRNLTSNVTVLSGDFNNNDGGSVGSFTGREENANRVVLGVNIPNDGATVLDGFTIQGGNASGGGFIMVSGQSIDRNMGGGMYNYFSSPVLTNVTISGNQADYSGGGMSNSGSSSPQIRNSIIWENRLSNGTNNNVSNYSSSSSPAYSCSLVQGLNPSGAEDGGNNMDGANAANDPLFASPASYSAAPTTAGNYRLQAGSPVINKGSNSFYNASQTPDLSAITTDRDGGQRIKGSAVDMGAYEY
jgi:hypothetical protein